MVFEVIRAHDRKLIPGGTGYPLLPIKIRIKNVKCPHSNSGRSG